MVGHIEWPNGARCAVAITFDPDFEALWLMNPENKDNPKTLSMGTYGALRGMPRLLDLLDEHEMKSTFFTVAHSAEHYPDLFRDAHRRGHEIAGHGRIHENLGKLSLDEVREVLRTNSEAIMRVTGERPYGFRAHGDYKSWVFKLLAEEGFVYDSSMKDSDVPYRMKINGRISNLIQIPFDWQLDDAPYFLFEKNAFPLGTARILSPDIALQSWRREFDGYIRHGLCYVLVLHPQLTGRPGRTLMLEELLNHMKSSDVWFARMIDIAKFWLEKDHG